MSWSSDYNQYHHTKLIYKARLVYKTEGLRYMPQIDEFKLRQSTWKLKYIIHN